MAWASKKQMAILYQRGDKGKDILERLPDMSADEFNSAFSKLIGKGGEATQEAKAKNESSASKDDAKAKKAEDKTLGDAKTASVDGKEESKDDAKPAEAKVAGYSVTKSDKGKTFADYSRAVKEHVSEAQFDAIMEFLSK
jgi:hypothetical protein